MSLGVETEVQHQDRTIGRDGMDRRMSVCVGQLGKSRRWAVPVETMVCHSAATQEQSHMSVWAADRVLGVVALCCGRSDIGHLSEHKADQPLIGMVTEC